MGEHRRSTDDAQEKTVHARQEDGGRSFLRRLTEYRILWLAGMAMAAWVGSRIVQPLNQIPVNTMDIAVLQRRADARDSVDRDWREVVKIVVRVQCATLSEGDKYKYNLCQSAPPEPK